MMICPVVVGREQELQVLAEGIGALHHGRGQMIALVGEAGIGKSRLGREVATQARARRLSVLVGRAVVGRAQVPFRPIAEALHSALRVTGLPPADDLVPFRPALGRLVPEWREEVTTSTDDDANLLMLSEGVLRLLRALGGKGGAVLVLEDLHWADPETLAVVEYLADNIQLERVLTVVTCRSEEPSPGLDVIRTLASRRTAEVVELHRLSDLHVTEMAEACLGLGPLSDRLRRLVLSRGDGIPFLIEELLLTAAGKASGGATSPSMDELGETVVPVSVADTVRRRLALLDPDAQSVLRAAATLGPSFPWRPLPSITGLAENVVLDLLAQGVAVQLVVSECDEFGVAFRFRHALTRDALLAALLPHERAQLARRTLDAIQRDHPGLPGSWCELASELAEAAGRAEQASRLLLETGRRALRRGALETAEAALDRARSRVGDDILLRADIDEALTEVLSLAGRSDEVAMVGTGLLQVLQAIEAPPARLAEVHLRLARAAMAGTRWSEANAHLREARSLDESGRGELAARVDALAAQVAMGEGRADDAVRTARVALRVAQDSGAADATCEALEVIGRAARLGNLDEAEAAFDRAARVAADHGLRLWRLRALHELGTVESLGRMGVDRLSQARRLAEEAGALSTVALIDLQLAGTYPMRFEPQAALEAADRCSEAARRFRFGVLLPMALIHAAAAHAVAGRRPEMEVLLGEALALAGDHTDAHVLAWGHCRAMLSLLEENRAQALDELDRAVEAARRPDCMNAPACWGLRAILRTLEGADGGRGLAEAHASPLMNIPLEWALLRYADAVAYGRAGQAEQAVSAVASAEVAMAGCERSDGYRHLARRLVAEAAVGDGWGEPVGWLREAATFFESLGHSAVVSAARKLLARAGAPVPRRGRGLSVVPPGLAAIAMTSREVDVLGLVAAGYSNRQIADQLFLSVRTVEKHVERLMDKTGFRSRSELVQLARRAGVTDALG